ncbi:hypothetical protein [Halorubrum sp. BV1]|uniref:hypothetical protein n=1 Tax=Halorubrum sp. BV1 TaxID=1498500 RepID=UPI0006784D34|nr:hypothetical protein [Halorubrum sp. BV1]
MIATIIGFGVVYIAIVVSGAFVGSFAEYVSVERKMPTLHAGAVFVSAAAGAVLAVPGQWIMIHLLGGDGSTTVVSVAVYALAAAAAQRTWFTTSYAYSRELKMEYGDGWTDHIGEEVAP